MKNEFNQTTPIEYLFSLGIDLNKTTLLTVIDEHLRQINLEKILEDYSNIRINENSKSNI